MYALRLTPCGPEVPEYVLPLSVNLQRRESTNTQHRAGSAQHNHVNTSGQRTIDVIINQQTVSSTAYSMHGLSV